MSDDDFAEFARLTSLSQMLKERIIRCEQRARDEHQSISTLTKGLKIRVTSDYNTQAFGRSKKSLKGSILTIRNAYLDMYHGVSFQTEEYPYAVFIGLDEVEFVE
jgi:hypothetical protein